MVNPVILDGGNIRLICGDCLDIMPTLDPGYFKIAVDRIQKELEHRLIPIDQTDKPKDGKVSFF